MKRHSFVDEAMRSDEARVKFTCGARRSTCLLVSSPRTANRDASACGILARQPAGQTKPLMLGGVRKKQPAHENRHLVSRHEEEGKDEVR